MRCVLIVLVLAAASVGCGRIRYDDSLVSTDGGPRDGARGDAHIAVDGAVISEGGISDGATLDAETCSEDPCRLVLPQCGCPSGQMCTRPFPMSAVRECRAAGTIPPGDACTFSTECTAGTACIRANGAGVCERWCASAGDCPESSICLQFTTSDPSVGACSVLCDPVTSAGCPATMACYVAYGRAFESGEDVGVAFCAGVGTVPVGSPCTSPFECVRGALCNGTCEHTCAVGSTCESGPCVAATPDITVAGVQYGYCP